jgi:hypothetical protein
MYIVKVTYYSWGNLGEKSGETQKATLHLRNRKTESESDGGKRSRCYTLLFFLSG